MLTISAQVKVHTLAKQHGSSASIQKHCPLPSHATLRRSSAYSVFLILRCDVIILDGWSATNALMLIYASSHGQSRERVCCVSCRKTEGWRRSIRVILLGWRRSGNDQRLQRRWRKSRCRGMRMGFLDGAKDIWLACNSNAKSVAMAQRICLAV